MKIKALILVFGMTVLVPSTGKIRQRRIVGGATMKPGDFPFMVYIEGTRLDCTGIIISENLILTAAHCNSIKNNTLLKVFSGLVELPGPYSQSISIGRTYTPTNYLFSIKEGLKNDLLLIELSEPLIFNKNVSPIILSMDAKTMKFSNATMAGWGQFVYNQTAFSKSANYINDMFIIKNDECRARISEYFPDMPTHFVTEDHLCYLTFGNQPRDSCSGDSGGPLIVYNKKGTPFLIGMISFGSKYCGLGGLSWTIFTRISSYINWIKLIMKEREFVRLLAEGVQNF